MSENKDKLIDATKTKEMTTEEHAKDKTAIEETTNNEEGE